MTRGSRPDVQRLLDRAIEAVDRGSWDSAARLAGQVLTLDPDNTHATALLTLMELRSERRRGRAAGTRRRVTVMFCDMVGSTEFASRLDPEDMRDVLRDFLRSCAEAIEELDGHVASLLGDGLLAYFGFPRAHEDDAVRAVLAGRRIVERMRALPLLRVGDTTCRAAVRVGIHTGLAVAAELGVADRAHTNDVVGETPNLAARIQSAASPNSVVISSDTAALVGDLFDLQRLPPVAMKGILRKVDLFEVEGRRPVRNRYDAAPRRRASLVGRRREQEAIDAAWAASRSSGGPTLALVGEPGIGKSRLLAYAKAMVATDGGAHRTLQCSPHHLSTPLHPVASALEHEGRVAGSESAERAPPLAEVAERLGFADPLSLLVLSRLLRIRPPPGVAEVQLSPEELRERTLTLIVTWLERLAGRSPLLLAVEDLHWADPTTLELLARVTSRPAPVPLLTIVTSRETAPLSRLGEVATLAVGPLGHEDCARMIDDVAGGGGVPDAARQLIVERSDGVPLYAEELTRMLRVAASDWQLSVDEVHVPPTLLDLLVARLDQYPSELRVAQVVATVGQPVGLPLLRRLLPYAPDELRRQLDVLVEARLLRVIGDGPEALYEFRHTLQREAAYQLQLRATRRVAHAEVAAALAGGGETAAASPELLAHHHERAEEFPAAAQHRYRAGVQYAAVAAHAEAIQQYERALAALERARSPVPEQLELSVRGGLAASLLATRGYTSPDVAAAYGRLRGLASFGGRHELPSLFGVWAYYHTRGENHVSSELAQRMLGGAVSSGDSQDVLAALAVVGKQQLWGGDFRGAARTLRRARAHGQPGAPGPFPQHAGIGAMVHLAWALWALGMPRRARAELDRAVAAAEALGAPNAEFTRAYTHCYAASLSHIAHDLEAAERHARRAMEISTTHGFATWRAAARSLLSIVGGLTLEPAAHIPTIQRALAASRKGGAEAGRSHVLFGLAQAHTRAGQPGEALAAIEEALQHAAATGERVLQSPLRRLRGELLLAVAPEEPLRAAAELRAAADVARRQGARAFEVAALASLVRVQDGAGSSPVEQQHGRDRAQADDPQGQPGSSHPAGVVVQAD
jgi:class 3 adenylate cyclase/tetratricopeptide (TPR) repeat protein